MFIILISAIASLVSVLVVGSQAGLENYNLCLHVLLRRTRLLQNSLYETAQPFSNQPKIRKTLISSVETPSGCWRSLTGK
ncbi:MAG: hypothetical protein HC881_18505 [Leptolyngbyaceae cyanobacterium SL_7_1]|nr:hypothetical protein [Leptolyngbyaceae cyanobacterium SL_7_1]